MNMARIRPILGRGVMSLALIAGVSAAVLQTTAGTASAATGKFYVNNVTGNDGGQNTCVSKKAPCKSIDYALTQASGGGTIFIQSTGVPYNEQVTITTNNITLKGKGKNVIIDPQAASTETSANDSLQNPDVITAFEPNATDTASNFYLSSPATVAAIIAVKGVTGVTITNVTVDGAGTDASLYGNGGVADETAGIEYSSASGTVTKDTVENVDPFAANPLNGPNDGAGFGIYGNDGSGATNLTVTHDKVNTYGPTGVACNGVTTGDTNCTVSFNTVTGNGAGAEPAGYSPWGIVIQGDATGTVSSNTVTANSNTGSSCFITDVCGAGVVDFSTAGPTISSNKVSGNDYGIYADGNWFGTGVNGTISNNTADNGASTGGAGVGIALAGNVSGLNVANNVADNNPLAGIALVGAGVNPNYHNVAALLDKFGAFGPFNPCTGPCGPGTGGLIQGNTADSNKVAGIAAISGSSNATITRNTTDSNGLAGIALDAAGVEGGNQVTDNVSDSNSDAGIGSFGSSNSTIEGNTVTKNLAGMYIGGPSYLHLNEFCGVDTESNCYNEIYRTSPQADAAVDPSRTITDGAVNARTHTLTDAVTTTPIRTVQDANVDDAVAVSNVTGHSVLGVYSLTTTGSFGSVAVGDPVVATTETPSNNLTIPNGTTVTKVVSSSDVDISAAPSGSGSATFSEAVRTISDAILTPDSPIIGSSSADFTNADIGAKVSSSTSAVNTGLGGGTYTIVSVQAANQATLSGAFLDFTEGDGFDASVTITGTNVLTSASANFTSADVGAIIEDPSPSEQVGDNPGQEALGSCDTLTVPTAGCEKIKAVLSSGSVQLTSTPSTPAANDTVSILGSNTLTSASANFTSADLDAQVACVSTCQVQSGSTITAVDSSTTVTLSSAAAGTPTGGHGSTDSYPGQSVTVTESPILTSTQAVFSPVDVGALVCDTSAATAPCPAVSGGASDIPAGATIVKVISGTQALLSTNATGSVTGDHVLITDDDNGTLDGSVTGVVESASTTFSAADVGAVISDGSSHLPGTDTESLGGPTVPGNGECSPSNLGAGCTVITAVLNSTTVQVASTSGPAITATAALSPESINIDRGYTLGGGLCSEIQCTQVGASVNNTVSSNNFAGNSGVGVLADGPGSPEWAGPLNPEGIDPNMFAVAGSETQPNKFNGNNWPSAWDYSGPPGTNDSGLLNTWTGDTVCDPTTSTPQCS